MKDVILTGFMGTGKSTVGKILAYRYGLSFVDTDDVIERLTGRSIAAIFEQQGEEAFRRMETNTFQKLLRGEGQIIATGGGTLLSERNRALLGPTHTVMCLHCDQFTLYDRLAGQCDRPLLYGDGLERISSLLEARRDLYGQFEQVDTSSSSADEVAEEIARRVGLDHAGSLNFIRKQTSDIRFGRGLLKQSGELLRTVCPAGLCILISDETVSGVGIVERVCASLSEAGWTVDSVILPPGEVRKTLGTIEEIYGHCMRAGADRFTMVMGLGGGVICDMAGMVAATYNRGLKLALAPTTLLAQVDAAIGGKVGVDYAGAKNLIGAFYPARAVFIDPEVLCSLPGSALSDGLAEVVKIGAIRSLELIEAVAGLSAAGDIHAHPEVIRRAAREKAAVVKADPYERDERMLLNFGHTIGHGLEAASGYALSHGQAVAAGMVAETWLAEQTGRCKPGVLSTLTAVLSSLGLPTRSPGLSVDEVHRFVLHDKKRERSTARMALPVELGRGAVTAVTDEEILDAIKFVLGESD